MKEKNVLIIEYSGEECGHAHYVAMLANNLKELDCKVYLLSKEKESELKNMVNIPYYAKPLNKIIKENKINTIHFFQSSLRKNLPFLIKNKITKKVKTVYTVHNLYLHERNSLKSILFNLIQNKIIFKLVDHIIVHSQHIKDKLTKKLPEDKISVVYHGNYGFVDKGKYTRNIARKKLGFSEELFVILMFGAIREYKGLKYLFNAAKGMKNVKLVIAGEVWKDMKDYVNKIKKDTIVYLDDRVIPTEEIELFYKAADVAAYPYTNITTSGALMVAMMLKTPIIVTNTDSMKEIAGGVSVLVKPRDSESLRKALRYLKDNPKLRRDLAEKAYERAKNKYSWKKSAEKTKIIYDSL